MPSIVLPRPMLLRDILSVYVLLTAFRVAPRLKIGKHANFTKNLQTLYDHLLSTETLKQTCFGVALPRVYAALKRRYPGSPVPVVLSAPLFYLLRPSLRKTVAVYVATVAAVNFRRESKQRRMLPPTWTLLVAANSWLLWAFLFERHLFPKGYAPSTRATVLMNPPTNSLNTWRKANSKSFLLAFSRPHNQITP
ncbi:hypothetical protein BU17DRAFT_89056 [Hysterangium stoloniferum]|nr:hypothetical protein BU17DRAFT_89056 [Hysterangium stoloniferum]